MIFKKRIYSYKVSCFFITLNFNLLFCRHLVVTSIKLDILKSHSILTHFLCYEVQLSFIAVYMNSGLLWVFPLCVCTVCTHTFMCLKYVQCKLERYNWERGSEEGERERLTDRGGLGGPGHRWLWEADVSAELFRVVPASSETETEVLRANRLPQNGWLDLGKQMLKNASRAQKCHHARYNVRKQQPS